VSGSAVIMFSRGRQSAPPPPRSSLRASSLRWRSQSRRALAPANERPVFSYERKLALAFDVGWPGPLALVAGLALVAAAVTAIVVGSRPWLVVASFAVAVALGLLVFDTEDQRLSWAGPGGVIGYESPHGGALLQPAHRRAAGGGPSVVGGPQPRLGADWRRERLLVARTHRLAGLPLVRAGAPLADRLQALPAALRPLASVSLVAAATAVIFVWLVLRTLTRLA
jgi:hypothetical protein